MQDLITPTSYIASYSSLIHAHMMPGPDSDINNFPCQGSGYSSGEWHERGPRDSSIQTTLAYPKAREQIF